VKQWPAPPSSDLRSNETGTDRQISRVWKQICYENRHAKTSPPTITISGPETLDEPGRSSITHRWDAW
jgi:hypothetical protein